jgi:hypothetical protein
MLGFQPQNDSSEKSSVRRQLVFQQNRPQPASRERLLFRLTAQRLGEARSGDSRANFSVDPRDPCVEGANKTALRIGDSEIDLAIRPL